MTKRLISFFLVLALLIVIPLSARYRYNPYTTKLDYYEAAGDIALGDIGDITLTGLATGNVLYYNGAAWVNLATGANGEVLTLAGGIPSWAAGGAPAAHAASHEVAGADLVDHDLLTNYLANEHIDWTNATQNFSTQGSATLNDNGSTGETGLNLYSINNTFSTIAQSDAEGIALKSDLRIGLDETTRRIIICDIGDIGLDFAFLNAEFADPTLCIFNADNSSDLQISQLTGGVSLIEATSGGDLTLATWGTASMQKYASTTDAATFSFRGQDDTKAMTHNAGEGVWMNVRPAVNQAGTAAYIGLLVDSRETATGTGDKELLALRLAGADRFTIATTGAVTQGSWTATQIAAAYLGAHAVAHEQGGGDGVDHDNLPNFLAADHVDHTGVSILAGGLITGGGAINATRTLTLTEATIEAAIDTLGAVLFTGDVTMNEDLFITWADVADHAVITQSNAAGTEGQPLIFIDDNRTGATASSESEATIVIDAEGVYALYVMDGNAWFANQTYFIQPMSIRGNSVVTDTGHMAFGNGSDATFKHIISGTGDDFFCLDIVGTASVTEAIWIADWAISEGWGNFTDLDNFLSPTLVIVNAEGADAKDYSAVMIGERGQADVKVAHYFDFYAMTGAIDGVVDPANAELASIFRFGATGTTVPITATTPGDVLFEGKIEVVDWIKFEGVDNNQTYGYQAGANLTATQGLNNILIGYQAGLDLTTGDGNVSIGYHADYENATGSNNIAIGYESLMGAAGQDHSANVGVGYYTLRLITTGTYNVAVGYQAGQVLTSGGNNVFVGNFAGGGTTTTSNNMFLGYYAGGDCQGSHNVALGYQAGYRMDAGSTNVNVGYRAGAGQNGFNQSNTVHIGADAARRIKTASGQVAIGAEAAYYNLDATGNVIIGYQAAKGTADNDYGQNTIIGYEAAEDITTGDGNIVIGYMAGEGWLTTEANKFVVANTDTAMPFMYGDMAAGDMVAADLIHNSDHCVMGYSRTRTLYWQDSFDHGSTAAKYDQDWETAALNTQGNGTNTIQTTPSRITLTTDNNAIGDNEGTRTDYAVIVRARQNRSQFGVDLGQTVNTQFYCGWNTSGTNAMVAAADEYVIIFFDHSDNANWQIKVGDGATEDVFTTAVAADTNHICLEIWVETDGTVHLAIDHTEIDITGTVDNLMDAANHYLIVGQAQSVTGAAAIVAEIDFVENEKAKDH